MREISYKSPLYIQLREVIRSKIEEEEYLPGTAIPSENQLMETYGLNRVSVRSALAAREFEGLLKSVQGKGVFVAGPKAKRNMTPAIRNIRPKSRRRKPHLLNRNRI